MFKQKNVSLLLSILIFSTLNILFAQRKPPQVIAVIESDTLFKLLEPDGIPAIRVPEFVSGNEAQDQMSSNEPVLGLIVEGEARAYSLWQLDHHEIVNDYFGDLPVAVTW